MAEPSSDQQQPMFTIASFSIPAGVRCRACGRLHLPKRLRPTSRDDVAITLQCPRCGACGALDVDRDDPVHVEIMQAILRRSAE
jgi:hypothetical protein